MQIMLFAIKSESSAFADHAGFGGFLGVKNLDPFCFENSGYLKEFAAVQMLRTHNVGGLLQIVQKFDTHVLVETWSAKTESCLSQSRVSL